MQDLWRVLNYKFLIKKLDTIVHDNVIDDEVGLFTEFLLRVHSSGANDATRVGDFVGANENIGKMRVVMEERRGRGSDVPWWELETLSIEVGVLRMRRDPDSSTVIIEHHEKQLEWVQKYRGRTLLEHNELMVSYYKSVMVYHADPFFLASNLLAKASKACKRAIGNPSICKSCKRSKSNPCNPCNPPLCNEV